MTVLNVGLMTDTDSEAQTLFNDTFSGKNEKGQGVLEI